MTKRDAVFPANRHALYDVHRYSAAIRSGDLLFVSGQVGSREDGSPEPVFAKQVQLAFDNLADRHSKRGWFRLTAGVRLADPEPVLGLNWRGKVVPFVPRAQPLFSYVNPDHELAAEAILREVPDLDDRASQDDGERPP